MARMSLLGGSAMQVDTQGSLRELPTETETDPSPACASVRTDTRLTTDRRRTGDRIGALGYRRATLPRRSVAPLFQRSMSHPPCLDRGTPHRRWFGGGMFETSSHRRDVAIDGLFPAFGIETAVYTGSSRSGGLVRVLPIVVVFLCILVHRCVSLFHVPIGLRLSGGYLHDPRQRLQILYHSLVPRPFVAYL
nr:hypothetical protein CFP56_78173 [Quercus suber]